MAENQELKLEKFKGLSLKKADAAADIRLINQYTAGELTPEEVYCFSLVLCDNDVDRDLERFTNASLDAMAPLFLGKTGLSDHRWSVDRQMARIYRTDVEDGGAKNALGEPLRILRGNAYMLNNEVNQPLIEAINGGIMKEISIGCSAGKCSCSICGELLRLDWRTLKYQCEAGHVKGDTYEGKLCIGNLEEIVDAYEFSFVAVPAQRNAGVTKSLKDLDEAFELLMTADLSEYGDKVKALIPLMNRALMGAAEREERAEILAKNEAYLRRGADKTERNE